MKEQISKLFGFTEKSPTDELKNIPVADVVPSPYQPRTVFDDDKLDELCQTIRTHGVIQPIVVRVRNNHYELIAGERRLRAVRKLGYETIPAVIRDFNDSQSASIALIENLQRENLTAIEEAVAYQQLMVIYELTQESLAQRLGKSQSTIANKIRLLQLPELVKAALLQRHITERHARALLVLDTEEIQLKVLDEIIAKDLNVKQTETRIKFLKELVQEEKKSKRRVSFSKDVRLALNTIRQSVEMVASSGLNINTAEQDFEDHYEIVIKIPKKS
ncbi:nucleoid occlusion protein [Paenibacillus sp. N1-5-1-14]|uniref:nucleoid occlusion protein n=1 Tax=Paenibacillus radicibacter TaxID=2972488 RepID=UPI002159B292|nr:nucleoid occlusion protein [Paenibacillus radicibacter]MCR8643001.1 nucleoid occlusion protein [Paenibacillus radicibacter]